MDIADIKNIESFDLKEQYHIKSLCLRKDDLDSIRSRSGRLDERLADELRALRWIFSLLEEISSE
jgi:hypothetical protein